MVRGYLLFSHSSADTCHDQVREPFFLYVERCECITGLIQCSIDFESDSSYNQTWDWEGCLDPRQSQTMNACFIAWSVNAAKNEAPGRETGNR
jgi:hypothetical protein